MEMCQCDECGYPAVFRLSHRDEVLARELGDFYCCGVCLEIQDMQSVFFVTPLYHGPVMEKITFGARN